jgi:hypothetical protein
MVATGSYEYATSNTAVPTDRWVHVAVTKAGGVLRQFLDGLLVGSNTLVGTAVASQVGTVIGRDTLDTTRDFNGYIDDLRITKGVARYTANFTPPAEPFSLT